MNVPVMIATHATASRTGPYGGGVVFSREADKAINVILYTIVGVLVLIFTLGIIGIATREETRTVINAKVVEARYIRMSKSNRYVTEFKLTVDGKYTWWSSDDVAADRCPRVHYNVIKPIWHITTTDVFGSYTRTAGMITFCDGGAK